ARISSFRRANRAATSVSSAMGRSLGGTRYGVVSGLEAADVRPGAADQALRRRARPPLALLGERLGERVHLRQPGALARGPGDAPGLAEREQRRGAVAARERRQRPAELGGRRGRRYVLADRDAETALELARLAQHLRLALSPRHPLGLAQQEAR